MPNYANRDGDSPIVSWEEGPDYIAICFKGRMKYTYTNASAGSHHVSRMKQLAASGAGLASYISDHAKHGYASKERY
jgi:hypothetical protein